MEFRQLQYFMAVCEEMHFTRAADKLDISQPTLSQQIRTLENELDTPLFDRIGKKIALTEAGTVLLHYSTQIMQNMYNAKEAIGDLRKAQTGILRIAVLPSDLDYRITELLSQFHHDFPGVKLQVIASVHIDELVLDNEVDIGINVQDPLDERFTTDHLCHEEYVLVVPQGHPLYLSEQVMPLEDLRHIQTIMYPIGFIGRDIIESFTRKRGFSLKTIMETSSVTSVLSLVKRNCVATIQPYRLIQQINDATLHCIPIIDDIPFRDLFIVHRADRYIGLAARSFMQRAHTFFNDTTFP